MIVAGLLLLAGCTTVTTTFVDTCTVDAQLSATEGAPGDVVTITGGPFSEVFDTSVRVRGVAADVTTVLRDECALCDECVDAADCSPCGTCSDCAELCDLCVETTTFVVPDVAGGPTTVVLVNRWGSTDGLPFDVINSADTDTGVPDTDTGAPDTDTDGGDTDTGGDTDAPEARSAPRNRFGLSVLADLGVCPPA